MRLSSRRTVASNVEPGTHDVRALRESYVAVSFPPATKGPSIACAEVAERQPNGNRTRVAYNHPIHNGFEGSGPSSECAADS